MSYERLIVQQVSAERWEPMAASARLVVFKENLPPGYDRIDFALVVFGVTGTREGDVPLAYVTCRELDKEALYLKHGGAFPPAEKSIYAVRAYEALLAWCFDRYQRLTMLTENTNRAYLKLALNHGFVPIGIRNFKGSILVELFQERK